MSQPISVQDMATAIRAKKSKKRQEKFVDRNEILLPLPRREMSV